MFWDINFVTRTLIMYCKGFKKKKGHKNKKDNKNKKAKENKENAWHLQYFGKYIQIFFSTVYIVQGIMPIR